MATISRPKQFQTPSRVLIYTAMFSTGTPANLSSHRLLGLVETHSQRHGRRRRLFCIGHLQYVNLVTLGYEKRSAEFFTFLDRARL